MADLEPGYIYARLKPYNKSLGFVRMRYSHSPSGLRFLAPGEWHVIPAEYEAVLAGTIQNDSDPSSPLAFDFAHNDLERKGREAEYRQLVLDARRRSGQPTHEMVRTFRREDLRNASLTTQDLHPEDEAPVINENLAPVDIPEPDSVRAEAIPVSEIEEPASKKRRRGRPRKSASRADG